MFRLSRKVVLVVLGSSFALLTRTEAFTFNFSGFIQSATPGSPAIFYPQFVAGTAFTATITVVDGFALPNPNPAAPVSFYSDQVSGSPPGPKPLQYSILLADGRSFQDYTPIGSNIRIENTAAGDSLSIFGESYGGNGLLSFTFFDSTGRALSSSAWTTDYGSIYWESIGVDFSVFGFGPNTGSSFHGFATIPDSGTNALLLAIGVVGLLAYGRIFVLRSRS